MGVSLRGKKFHYRFQIRGADYSGVCAGCELPENASQKEIDNIRRKALAFENERKAQIEQENQESEQLERDIRESLFLSDKPAHLQHQSLPERKPPRPLRNSGKSISRTL